jgi:hypothetical protein
MESRCFRRYLQRHLLDCYRYVPFDEYTTARVSLRRADSEQAIEYLAYMVKAFIQAKNAVDHFWSFFMTTRVVVLRRWNIASIKRIRFRMQYQMISASTS